jgi:hypothetical protein
MTCFGGILDTNLTYKTNTQRRNVNRRNNRNRQRGFGAGGLWQTFVVQRTPFMNVAAATTINTQNFNNLQLIGSDLNSASLRSAQLKRCTVRFNPIGMTGFNTTQPLDAQLNFINVDGQVLTMTKAIPLSMTNTKTLSFSLPFNYSEMRTVGDTAPVIQIQLLNRAASAAVAASVYFVIEAEFYLDADANSSI